MEQVQPDGLPVAGPTRKRDRDNQRRWCRIELWDADDAAYNLGLRLKQVERDYQTLTALHSYIQERYGEAPAIPRWEMDNPDAALWWENLDDDVEPNTTS